jgi:hypothetical protein
VSIRGHKQCQYIHAHSGTHAPYTSAIRPVRQHVRLTKSTHSTRLAGTLHPARPTHTSTIMRGSTDFGLQLAKTDANEIPLFAPTTACHADTLLAVRPAATASSTVNHFTARAQCPPGGGNGAPLPAQQTVDTRRFTCQGERDSHSACTMTPGEGGVLTDTQQLYSPTGWTRPVCFSASVHVDSADRHTPSCTSCEATLQCSPRGLKSSTALDRDDLNYKGNAAASEPC